MNIGSVSGSLAREAEVLKLRYMGLGFVLAWIYCLWFSGAVLSEQARGSFATLLLSMAGSAVTLLVLARVARGDRLTRDAWIVVPPLVMSLTTVVLAFDGGGPAGLLASLLGGVSSAFLWLQWGRRFCMMEQETLESNVSGLALVAVATATITVNLPHVLACVVVAALPIVSGIMLLTCEGTDPDLGDVGRASRANASGPGDASQPTQAPMPFSALVPVALCSSVFSAASSLVIGTANATNSLVFGANVIVAIIGGGIIAVGMFFATLAFASRIDFSFLYKWLVPVMIVSLACASLPHSVVGTMGVLLSGSVAFMTDCLFIIVFVKLCRQGVCDWVVAFGLFRGCVQLGASAGIVLGLAWGLTGLPMLVAYQAAICMCAFVPMLVVALEKRFMPGGGTRVSLSPDLPVEPVQDEGPSAIARMCDRYKLSPREAEILALIVRGRSVPYIREALAISKNTIETHIKHIYAKADVHSKQELLDLVESMGVMGE